MKNDRYVDGIYTMDANGDDFCLPSRTKVLTLEVGPDEDSIFVSTYRKPRKHGEDYLPSWAWSPDGTKVALSTYERDSTQRILWTSVEQRAFGELVPQGPQVSLYGWLH